MNDAPSAIISPYGETELVYTKNDDADLADKILMHTIKVDAEREIYSLMYRSPSSYQAIANEFYRPTLGNTPVSGLPESGDYNTLALSYVPDNSTIQNLNKIEYLLNKESDDIDIVTLPAYGLTKKAINSNEENLQENKDVQKLQDIVDDRDIELMVTQINVKEKNEVKQGMLVLQDNKTPIIVGQLHDEVSKNKVISGTHEEPFYLDLENARVGIITGNDYMFPETVTSLAKMGTDIVLISSDIIDNEKSEYNYSYVSNDYMENSISTLISHCVHMAVSDSSGYAEVIESQWGIKKSSDIVSEKTGVAKLTLNTSLTRYKYLQEYLPVDIETFLNYTYMCDAA